MHANHFPPGVPIQQLNVAYVVSPVQIAEIDSKSKDKSKGKKKLGSDDGIKKFQRNPKDTCRH